MCGKNFAFWCCVLLLVISSKTQKNFTSSEEKDDKLTVRYELDKLNSTTKYDDKMETLRYNLHEKFTQHDDVQFGSRTSLTSNNDDEDDDSIRYKLDTHFIHNHEEDKQIPMESRIYSINTNYKRNFALQEIYRNVTRTEDKNYSEFFQNFSKNDNRSNVVPYEMCENITCIPLCCPLGDRLIGDKCISENNKYFFPNIYGYTNDSLQSKNKSLDEFFRLVVYDSCQKNYRLHENYNDYMIFANGSLYLPYYKIFVKSTSYCLAIVNEDKFKVIICSKASFVPFDGIFNITNNEISSINNILISISPNIICILFLLLIILVYSILPELRNAFGFMLRNYSGALCVAYAMWIVNFLVKAEAVQYSVCITIAFFTYYSFLASTLWLTLMSFDMWCTFREFCPQKNVRQREKRKLMFHAIFAWGFSFIFATACIIMDFVSEDLPKILRPKFRAGNCWFAEKETLALYYYGFKSICVISSIYLSISTALKIACYDKDTSLRLTDSESKRYNDNKKWFNLYLKLFIMQFIIMGIKWLMKTALFFSEDKSNYILHAINLMDIIQNLCTFIILVWKKKIKQMLIKRFGLLLKG